MKANKQGISLIVLVITIVVVIILAAAVILSLNGNNPIDNARIANFAQTKDGLYSAIFSYTGTVQGKTQGYFSNDQILLGSVEGVLDSNEPVVKAGSTAFAIVKGTKTTASATTPAKIVATETPALMLDGTTEITVYELDPTDFKANVGEDLPAAPINGSHWMIDEEGKVYLYFDDISKMPSWMGYDKNGNDHLKDAKADTTIAATVLQKVDDTVDDGE